jgi:uncharacterized phiE125 gp8 family phage protein
MSIRMGTLEVVTAPSIQLVTTAEVKAQAKIEISEDDALLDAYIERATEYLGNEVDGGMQFRQTQFDLPVSEWWDAPLKLPRPPFYGLNSLKYYDTAGTQQTLNLANVIVRRPWRQPGTIEWAPRITLPSVDPDREFPITVRFEAGWGAANEVPAQVKQAVVLLVAQWYRDREAASEVASRPIEHGVRALLDSLGYGAYA